MHYFFNRHHTQKGYSLIELLIYIAIFAVLSIVLVRSLVTVMRTYAAGARYRALQNNGELVMERITRELRAGTSAVTSTCATNPGTLSIASTDASSQNHTNNFVVTSGAVMLATDGGSSNAISTSQVTVTALTFCSFTTPSGAGVKTVLTLRVPGNYPTTASFYSTILLRGK